MSAGEGELSHSIKLRLSLGDFPPRFHVPTNILHNFPFFNSSITLSNSFLFNNWHQNYNFKIEKFSFCPKFRKSKLFKQQYMIIIIMN